MIKSDTGIKKAALQKEEQLYTYLIYLQALFYRNLINTILMTATVKFGREELCQNHIRFFSADEASRHNPVSYTHLALFAHSIHRRTK